MFKWLNPFSRTAEVPAIQATKIPVCGQEDIREKDEAERGQSAILDFPISRILGKSEVSVRLLNVAKSEDFPFRTVGDFLASSFPEQEILRVQNAGRKSAAEFIHLIREFLNSPEVYLPPNESTETQGERSAILDFPISRILDKSEVSVRLLNVAKSEDFPFRTVGDFLASSFPEQEILRVQNAGRKSAEEFIHLIKEFLNSPEVYLPSKVSTEIEDARSTFFDLFKAYSFPSFILDSSIMIPVRLQNVLKNIKESNSSDFSNLADCLQNFVKLERYFIRQPNAGRKSFFDLEKAIETGFRRITDAANIPEEHATNLFMSLLGQSSLSEGFVSSMPVYRAALLDLQKTKNDELLLLPELKIGFQVNEDHLLEALNEALETRALEIISRRFGIASYDHHTLQEVADIYSLTRERVRQIENGSIKRLRKLHNRLFKSYLCSRETLILEKLFEERYFFSNDEVQKRFFTLGALENLSIAVSYDEPRAYLKERCNLYGGYWISSFLNSEDKEDLIAKIDSGHQVRNLSVNIREAMTEMEWPLSVQGIYRELSAFKRSEIDSCLSDIFKVTIVNDHITKIEEGFNNQDRLNLVLRRAKRSLTTGEIKFFHDEMFGTEMSERHIGSVLSSMSKALITGRGTYDIYKNLSFSSTEIEEIRNECFDYLLEKQKYISAKVVFNDLYGDHKFSESGLNSHMLLGMLQDDARFDCKRGFMVGLATEESRSFVSLTDSLYEIVDLHGPIRTREIQRYLEKERSVLTVTIDMMLDASEDYVKIDTATFDRIDRVLGGYDNVNDFRNALQICLLGGPKNPEELVKILRDMGFSINNQVMLSSIVDKWAGFETKEGNISALKISDIVEEYNKMFLIVFNGDESLQKNRENLKIALPPELYHLYMVDYRLQESSSCRNQKAGSVDPESGEIIPIRLSGFKKTIDI